MIKNMTMTNQDIVDKFFDAYFKHDVKALHEVMADDVTWNFLGQHKLAGVKNGIHEVLSFFDIMGEIMSKSNPTVEKLIVCSKEHYFIECQHIKTNSEDGNNIDHHVCVLWTFENGKIISG
jgi:ketosteroid isomerase-like protein